MSAIEYRDHELCMEQVRLTDVANEFGTPCYVYSKAQIEKNARAYLDAFSHLSHQVCYAVKANSNIAVLQLLAKLGTGFDIVSKGELARVIAAGGDPRKVIFSGVGKSVADIEAGIDYNILCFNVESEPELDRIAAIAKARHKVVDIMLRVNPDIDAKTHSYISTGLRENKFGMNLDDLVPIFKKIKSYPSIKLIGVGAHIGSQITELQPFLLALDHLIALYHALNEYEMTIDYLDIGGGLGIVYRDETPPLIAEYAAAIQKKIANLPITLLLEPGRSIVADAGVLLTKIEYLKDNGTKHFAITDAGMNDLLRPALYEAWQDILPVQQTEHIANLYDVTGPVCESGDFLGKCRSLAIAPGELLAVDCAGAYGFSMSSNYNARCRPPEVLVAGSEAHLIRRRETIEDAINLEMLLAE